MTATTTRGGGAGRGGGWRWLVLLLGAVVLTVIVTPSGDDGRAYDLDSAQPAGYRGLRLLLQGTGTDIDTIDADEVTSAAAGRYDTIFIPEAAGASDEMAARWAAYARAGGHLVFGGPSVGVGPRSTGLDTPYFASGVAMEPSTCTIAGLADAGSIDLPFVTTGVEVGAGDDSCYGDGNVAVVVARPVGDGDIVALATPDLFTNETMGAPDPDEEVGDIPGNAVVAQRLLGGGGVGGRLAVVTSGIDGTAVDGTKSLTDFMSTGVKLGLLELGVAFAFYAFHRGRRNGRVVTEDVPVAIAGSAFVEAVGSLLERQGDHARAAEVLREGRCRELARRFGVPRSISRHDLAAVVAARTDLDAADVERLLTAPVTSEGDLVSLARDLDSLRQEALHV